MKKTTKKKALALSLMMAAMMLPMTMFAQQKNEDFFRVDDAYSGNRDVLSWTIVNNGIGQPEAPLGSGLLVLSAVGAGYAIARRKRNLKKGATLLLAALMLLGMTNCKKKMVEPTVNNSTVHITLRMANCGSRVDVNPTGGGTYATVDFEAEDIIYVGNGGKYVGFLTYNGTDEWSGDITSPTTEDYLHLYFLGNKAPLSAVTPGSTTEFSVSIADQVSEYPVISYNHTKEYYNGAGVYTTTTLYNKCSIMKFVVTTDSNAPICITGMNNKVTVDFSKAANAGNGFTYDKVTDDGIITLQGGSGTNIEKWAIVLPTETATPAGDEGSVYTYDGYKGSRPAISNPIAANQYLADGISMTVNTFDIKYAALTFEAETAGTIAVSSPKSGMQYSLNGGVKTPVTSSITVAANDKVYFFGNGTSITSYYGTKISGGTANVKVYGNIMSLVNETGYPSATTLTGSAFRELFAGNTHIKSHATKKLILSATMLTGGNSCNKMFNGCTGLTTLPELHVTTLGNYCYQNMFNGCTGLTSVPEDYLPATTLTPACYLSMFEGCTNLTSVPNLPATTLQPRCYYNMFKGCTKLTTVPSNLLPATTMANAQESKGCYEGMFQNCTKLENLPNLPAIVLKDRCYTNMFYGCTSLTTIPSNYLPAATLAPYCYTNMFRGAGMTTVNTNMMSAATTMAAHCCESMFRECPNLTNTPEIFATTLAEYCCNAMFYHSRKITTSAPLHATTLVENCYYNLFNGCYLLASVTCYATDISATDCTGIWLADAGKDVTGTKTFTTPSSTAWPTNTSGIPSGWTIVNL